MKEIGNSLRTKTGTIDLLHRIAEGDSGLKGLTPDIYHLTMNERLNEVINRAWNRCENVWQSFHSDEHPFRRLMQRPYTNVRTLASPHFPEIGTRLSS